MPLLYFYWRPSYALVCYVLYLFIYDLSSPSLPGPDMMVTVVNKSGVTSRLLRSPLLFSLFFFGFERSFLVTSLLFFISINFLAYRLLASETTNFLAFAWHLNFLSLLVGSRLLGLHYHWQPEHPSLSCLSSSLLGSCTLFINMIVT